MSKAQKILVLFVGIVFVIYIASQAPNTGTQTATDTQGETAKPKDRPQEEAWSPQSEMPTFLTQEDWCLVPTTSPGTNRDYKAVPGCKSFVIRQDTIVWRDRSCKVTSISKHVPKSEPEFSGHWWLRGYCSDGSVADFRFFEASIGKEHMLIQLFPPYFALGE